MPGLYRDRYHDLNVCHFHEKLSLEHDIELQPVKQALQEADGGRKRGGHRQRRPRVLLRIDGSRHRRFQNERWYDLIVILDDANSEIHCGELEEEESTRDGDGGAEGSDRSKGMSCAACTATGAAISG